MTDIYAYWKAALAGEKPKMFVDDPQPGFYRKGVYTKQENKARKRTGWTPAAIFINGAELAAVVGGNAITDRDQINDLWTYCAGNPISEETYRAVAERGEGWPDSHEVVVAARDKNYSLNPVSESAAPETVIAAQLDECTKQIIKYAKLDSDEMSAKARSLQNRFLELRGEAAKHYETANRPLLEQQKKLRELWFPLRDLADAGSVAMRTAMATWEDVKRLAAKQAEATGEKPNAPPPSSQIRGGAGRAANVGTKKVVTAIDIDAVFKHFRDDPRTLEFLTDLAQRAVRLGLTIPGVTVEEKADVR